jgi:outer membrane protein OmpA-like peptidoglycan-associated protein
LNYADTNTENDIMIGKITGMIFCFTAIIAQANAQAFGIELGGGMQGMQYSLKDGQVKLQPAGSFGLNYTFRLGSHFGFLTGVAGGLYRSQVTLQDGEVFTHGAVDDVGSAFESRVKFTGYKEMQHFFAVGVPLLLQYHGEGARQWYINGGAKLFVPFNASADISAQQASLTGYYPDFNVEVANLPQHGFGTINNWKSSTTLKLKPAAALSAAAGMNFRLSSGVFLSAGLFVDYGLTNLKANDDTLPLVGYSSNGMHGMQANSVLSTEKAGRATLLSYGVQIRLSFGHRPAKPAARTDTVAWTRIGPRSEMVSPSRTVTPSQPVTRPETADRPKAADRSKPIGQPQPAQALSAGDSAMIREPIIFGLLGETSIPEVQKPHLDQVAELLKRNPNMHISIVGHYCDGEMATEKRSVGEARAKAVARYLQSKDISRNRISYSAAGESDPSQRSDPGTNYQMRRVVIALN